MYSVEDYLKVPSTHIELLAGRILIAVPFYNDPFFNRSVVLLTEYDAQNCVGLMLNKKSLYTMRDLLPQVKVNRLLHFGGPVVEKMILAIHNYDKSSKYTKLLPGIYTGFDHELLSIIELNEVQGLHFKFFVGYSGWGPGQLQEELGLNMWVVGHATPELIFATPPEKIWESAVLNLGEEYKHWLHIPEYLSHN